MSVCKREIIPQPCPGSYRGQSCKKIRTQQYVVSARGHSYRCSSLLEKIDDKIYTMAYTIVSIRFRTFYLDLCVFWNAAICLEIVM